MHDPKSTPFLTDIQEIQRRAREHVLQGAVTSAYGRDVQAAVRLLNEALFAEANPGPAKAALAMRGKIAPEIRLPLVMPGEHTIALLRSALSGLGLL